MSEEIKNENENENENEDEVVESEPKEVSCEALFSDNGSLTLKKEKRISLRTAIFAAIALVLAAVMLTYTCLSGVYKERLAEVQSQNLVSGDDRYYPFELFDQIFSQLSFSELDEKEMMAAALKAYVYATGDQYAAYYTAEEYAAMMASSEGKTQGIGVNVAYTTIEYEGKTQEVIQIFHVTKDSPAYVAGIAAGDVIYAVESNGAFVTVNSLGYEAALQKLQGTAGTTAKFQILRKGNGTWGAPIEKSVERAEFTSDSVYGTKSTLDEKVGIVRIIQFDLTTPKQFQKVIEEDLKDCDRFIFDLRNNPGGTLQSIEAILSYFLSEGDVLIRVKDKAGNEEISTVQPVTYSGSYEGCSVSAADIGKYKGLRAVVLCNGATASAAELFTATFRDYGLGSIVGETTYGKGSMQTIIPLFQYGYTGALKLTTAMYYSGKDTQGYDGIGITPDYPVALQGDGSIYVREESKDNQLQFAIELLKQ